MRHESVDVKQLIVQIIAFVYPQIIEKALGAAGTGESTPTLEALTLLPAFSPAVMRSVLAALVNGAKERNLQLRANSENALVDLLLIRWPALHEQHLAVRSCITSLVLSWYNEYQTTTLVYFYLNTLMSSILMYSIWMNLF